MLVFIQIPKCSTRPYDAFRRALGEDAVGWVGRNITVADLSVRERLAGFKVVGGPITLAQAVGVGEVRGFATVLSDPIARIMSQWASAMAEPEHYYHDAAHTFMLREIFEEKHPFARALSNIATHFLTAPAVATPTARAALAALATRRFVIGEAAQPKPFVGAIARMLDVPVASLDESAFHAPPAEKPRGELMRLLRAANKEDYALIEGLQKYRMGTRRLMRTDFKGGDKNGPGAKARPGGPGRPGGQGKAAQQGQARSQGEAGAGGEGQADAKPRPARPKPTGA